MFHMAEEMEVIIVSISIFYAKVAALVKANHEIMTYSINKDTGDTATLHFYFGRVSASTDNATKRGPFLRLKNR